jgi:hypothetical protein
LEDVDQILPGPGQADFALHGRIASPASLSRASRSIESQSSRVMTTDGPCKLRAPISRFRIGRERQEWRGSPFVRALLRPSAPSHFSSKGVCLLLDNDWCLAIRVQPRHNLISSSLELTESDSSLPSSLGK